MLLGRGDIKAFREQRRCCAKRDKVRESVNKGITVIQEGENYSSLPELAEQPISKGRRFIFEHSDSMFCLNVTQILREIRYF